MNKLARGVAILALVATTIPSVVHSEIRRIVVDQRHLVAVEGAAPLPAYERLRGRLFGEVDPFAAQNAIIQDIEFAPRNEHGKVEYIATFTLLKPLSLSDSNRVLAAELPNRGNRSTPLGSDQEAMTFLRRRGYSVIWIGWQADLSERPDAVTSSVHLEKESLNAPRARGPSGESLTGPYLIRVPLPTGTEPSAPNMPASPGPSGRFMKLEQGRAGSLAYFPATYETESATLTGGPSENNWGRPRGGRYLIPPTEWTWWNCTADRPAESAASPADLCIKRTAGTFNPTESYTLVFIARDPIVLGLGMAATRDAVSFFRYETKDSVGTPNPLARAIDNVIGQGRSQVGNLVKTMIALGFNADEKGRRVWDGANAHIGARRTPINFRFATPGSSATLHLPGSEGVLWWGKSPNSVRDGRVASLLDRCGETRTCPKIFETLSGAELWNQRMTPGLVTFDLKRDIPLPATVRRYVFPGTQHGGGHGGFDLRGAASADPGACVLAPNPNSQNEQMRALFVALTDWVVKGIAPPQSRAPTLAGGGLVRDLVGILRTPRWPGAPQPHGIANPLLVYEYGNAFNYADMSGIITLLPPTIREIIPALVPQNDADGNELGGARSVYLMVPLGSYTSWNIYREGPYAGDICSFYGGFIPFANTKADRLTRGDDRLSIEERYGSRKGFVSAVRKASEELVHERFLLREDAVRLHEKATEAVSKGDLSFLPP